MVPPPLFIRAGSGRRGTGPCRRAAGRHALLFLIPLLLSLAALSAAAAQTGSSDADARALRRRLGPAVCTVTAENAWGIPVSVASGFVLGDGRFVLTDLGSVARPGVERAVIRFGRGRGIVAREFGLADAGLGLLALRVPGGRTPEGLRLADRLPTLDGGTTVSIVGFEWGKDLAVASGRLWRGPPTDTVANRARIRPPRGPASFLRMAGGQVHAASGAPLVGSDGTVLAVHLAVATPGIRVPLAMPAASLRESLLSAEPRLRPLSDLPTPAWPVEALRLAGEPPAPAGFQNARRHIRRTMVCSRCEGRGAVRMEVRGELSEETVPCPRCHGEGIALESGVFDLLGTWALEGTRAVWAPGDAEGIRRGARAAGRDMLGHLAKAGRHFRAAFADKAAEVVRGLGRGAPRGLVVYGEVRAVVPGPDGRYVILDPLDTDRMVAVRADDLAGQDGRGPGGAGRLPRERSWMLLAGTVVSGFRGGRYQGVAVLPFEWTGCPVPGPLPGRRR